MTHLANLQRDQFHVNAQNSLLTLSSASTVGQSVLANHSNNVQLDASGRGLLSTSITTAAGSWRSFGNIIQGNRTGDERESYRFKAYATGIKEMWAVLGFLPASPTGTDDAVSKVQAFPMENGYFDEVIMLKINEIDLGLPMFFGVAFGESTSSLLSAYVSVQRMSIAPPQYASSVS